MSAQKQVVVSGGFDDIKSRDLRFLEEASKLGKLTVLLWPDETLQAKTGQAPKFPLVERLYFLEAVRYVSRVIPISELANPNELPADSPMDIWADVEADENAVREQFCRAGKISYRVFKADELKGFPEPPPMPSAPGRKKIVATGSYDWFHSGHIRFLEEASGYGDLYVVVGHDANIRLLKGEGHPLFLQDERRYMVGAVRYVKQALISTGYGWMDAEPEIGKIKPNMYAVNEDGDKPEKREFCRQHGLQYVVLKRTPKEGLAQRSGTDLRGF